MDDSRTHFINKARPKRWDTAWFCYLCDILEKGNQRPNTDQWLPENEGRSWSSKTTQRNLGMAELFCLVLWWQIQDSLPLSSPQEHTSQGVNFTVCKFKTKIFPYTFQKSQSWVHGLPPHQLFWKDFFKQNLRFAAIMQELLASY